MKVTLDVDLEKLRYSLVGDGFLLSEVKDMSEEELVAVLTRRVVQHIEAGYQKSKRYGLLDGSR